MEISDELLDFWKTLWHVDVYKDHGSSYDESIVNKIIADDTYKTTQKFGDLYISYATHKADRQGGGGGRKVLDYKDLFEYLTGIPLEKIYDMPVGDIDIITLKEELLGKDVKYQIQVFNELGEIDGEIKLPEFINDTIALYVDTTSYLPEFLTSYLKKDNDIIYAYTRETESDAADKTTYDTITKKKRVDGIIDKKKNQEAFYYEMSLPENEGLVDYTHYDYPYNTYNKLTYFYCKHDVYLYLHNLTDMNKFRLNVDLVYMKKIEKENKKGRYNVIFVPEGANIAGVLNKYKEAINGVVEVIDDDTKKEMVFLSKHHGDIAQTLTQFRNVKMKCPKTDKIINTSDYNACFVSIDVNAITKALTIDTPYILMYSHDKSKIIAWKNISYNTPEEDFKAEKEYLLKKQEIFFEKVTKFNESVTEINKQYELFNEIIKNRLDAELEAIDTVEMYKDLLKFGITISTFSRIIPKKKIYTLQYQKFQFINRINRIKIEEGDDDNEIKEKISELKHIYEQMTARDKYFIIPPEFKSINIFEDDNKTLKNVSFEKETMMEFKNYTCKKNDSKILEKWQSIDLKYNMGENTITVLMGQFGSKLNNSWGFDIINYIYKSLLVYKSEYATKFIAKLGKMVSILPTDIGSKRDKLDTFNFGLGLLKIETVKRPVNGGNGSTMVMTQPHKTNRSNEINLAELKDKAIKIELNDIIKLLEFILTMIKLSENKPNLTKTRFENLGLDAFDKFFKSVFGPEYKVEFSINKPNRNTLRKNREGFLSKFGLKKGGNNKSHQNSKFDKGAEFLTASFSPITYCEDVINNIKHDNKYTKEINRINELLSKYYELENDRTPVKPNNNKQTAGRRTIKKSVKNKTLTSRSKFKTFKKKLRTNKKKTHKKI